MAERAAWALSAPACRAHADPARCWLCCHPADRGQDLRLGVDRLYPRRDVRLRRPGPLCWRYPSSGRLVAPFHLEAACPAAAALTVMVGVVVLAADLALTRGAAVGPAACAADGVASRGEARRGFQLVAKARACRPGAGCVGGKRRALRTA